MHRRRWYQRGLRSPPVQPPADRPWVIAHRGASAAAPENTVAAFRLAHRMGADAVELDVRRTGDGAIVVHHDDAVGGRPLVEWMLPDLRADHPAIPLLDEALAACAGMWVNVEVKNSPLDTDWDPDDTALPRILESIGAADVEISSFNPVTIGRVRQAAPHVPTGWLVDDDLMDPIDAVAAAAAAGHRAIHPDAGALAGESARRVVTTAHDAGLWVIVWTVDDPAEMGRLAEIGIDGIITNRPDAARPAVGG